MKTTLKIGCQMRVWMCCSLEKAVRMSSDNILANNTNESQQDDYKDQTVVLGGKWVGKLH